MTSDSTLAGGERLGVEAGRELDERVAVEVLGAAVQTLGLDSLCPACGGSMYFTIGRAWCSDCREWKYSPYPEYSTDIAAAWVVVEAMEARGWSLSLHRWWNPEDGRFWYANFEDRVRARIPSDVEAREITAPLAICLAALAHLEPPCYRNASVPAPLAGGEDRPADTEGETE